MIQLTNKTTIALLITLMKQNYGKAWYSIENKNPLFITAGIHAPSGEIAYSIPAEYLPYFKGMIELPESDLLDKAFENDTADRLLEWAVSL
jgi:hypothetical protein